MGGWRRGDHVCPGTERGEVYKAWRRGPLRVFEKGGSNSLKKQGETREKG